MSFISVFDVLGPNMIGPVQLPYRRRSRYRVSGAQDDCAAA